MGSKKTGRDREGTAQRLAQMVLLSGMWQMMLELERVYDNVLSNSRLICSATVPLLLVVSG
jgi:hypothetical protein